MFEGEVREYEKRLIKLLVEMGATKGQNDKFSAIIGYLLFHGSLTQEELKHLTGFSLGTISRNLNILVGLGSAKKKLVKGTHKFEYTLGKNISAVASSTSTLKKEFNEENVEFFQNKYDELYKLKDLDYKKEKERAFLLGRLEDLLDFFARQREMIEEISKPEFMAKILKGMKKL
jgi:DNA-binding transcriptional regulator GbsR (MarR family)